MTGFWLKDGRLHGVWDICEGLTAAEEYFPGKAVQGNLQRGADEADREP